MIDYMQRFRLDNKTACVVETERLRVESDHEKE